MSKYIYIETANLIARVNLDEVIYMEKQGRKILTVTESDEIEWYGTSAQMKALADDRFLTCHRSYIINMDKITKMEDNKISIECGHAIYFGRENFRKAMRQFREYISAEKSRKNDD